MSYFFNALSHLSVGCHGIRLVQNAGEFVVTFPRTYHSGFSHSTGISSACCSCQGELWKLLDFVKLKHSSISFFDLERHETVMSRWSRARTRAAKVGKDLSKNGKTQKLALQHWLEEIDPRHRYGHNLHFHYVKWLNY